MALEPLQIGDVTWDDLVALARRRIAAVTRGEWTLHAPVDPGMSLVELFAWLLEQRAYWLDQVPDPLVRSLLGLLGVAPGPEGVADTVLTFAGDGSWRVAPAGTAMRVVGAQDGPVFATDEALVVAPVRGLRVVCAGRDRSEDLAEGRWVQLLRADGGADQAELRLELASAPPAGVSAPLSILLALETSAALVPEWRAELETPPAALFAPDAPGAPSSAPAPARSWLVPVQFLYRRVRAGGVEVVPLPGLTDGTLGLRRAGLVRFQAPADWAAEADGSFALIVRAERTDFSVPPRVSAVLANAVIARHWQRVVVALKRAWLPLPGTVIDLPPAHGAPLSRFLRVHLRERATPPSWQTWRAVDDLSTSAPDARVVVVDRERARVIFGDGLTGRQPVLASAAGSIAPPIDLANALPSEPDANVIVEYLAGGGPGGSLGAGQAWVAAAGTMAWEASSPVGATGGHDAEPLAEARTRAAAELRMPHRAVTRPDHQELARTTPGVAVARAHAVVGHHPDQPCRQVPGATTVFIVPDAPRDEEPPPGSDPAEVRAPVPDPDTLALVQAQLDLVRLAGHEVFVRPPRYRDARLRFDVEADPRSPAALEDRVRRALERYLDPLVGGDEGSGWPFGEPLRPSALVRAAQQAVGREGEVRSVSIGIDGAAAGEVACNDVALGTAGLPRLGAVAVQLLPRRDTRGGLR